MTQRKSGEQNVHNGPVTDVWGRLYEGNDVPAGLMQRIEAHIQGCPLRLATA